MTSTQLVVRQDLINKLRTLTHNSADDEELNDLVATVRELLALVPDDPRNEKEYGFMVTLRAVARTRAMSQQDALLALAEFQTVDANVSYENVTITEMSFVPDEDLVLIDIDGDDLDQRRAVRQPG